MYAIRSYYAKGIGRIYITKRSHGLTNQLAKGNERVLVVDYDNRYDVIDCCDIVISSTTRITSYNVCYTKLLRDLAYTISWSNSGNAYQHGDNWLSPTYV